MPEIKLTRERLEKRRAEILAQLGEVVKDERIELDRDPEEQAIQVQQHDVAVSMEANLRKELLEIEDKLLDFEDEEKSQR